ncbi:Fe3+-hydroxamate ABC transporter substrate-binding protein [Paludifilum halophilum]|uniref:Fe3+-hydroxamate ABC transporter substrate-binding protein n=2 Tax=Paludifilum halophilum TaxID=1642702 RepID=A0A235B4Q8_9BACL|nr:Fe3+-hydroxamate ABC transporter substrate-binding protein [Paludifilum halophilum]
MAAASLSAGCSAVSSKPDSDDSQLKSSKRPVTLENYNRTLQFEKIPQRAVSLNQHTTEIMLALGLEERMAGTAYLDDEILPRFQKPYDQIPVLAERYPSFEVLLGAEPDFVIGRLSAFTDEKAGSLERLADSGIPAYVVQGTYAEHPGMEDVYEDIRNLGRIFDVESRAEKLIRQMKADIQKVQNRVGDREKPVRVLVYDSGEKGLYTTGNSLETELISLAGGKNVFSDLNKSWTEVGWEEAVKRNPEVIVINDYGHHSAEDKIRSIKENPALKHVTAVREERFVVLPLSDVFEGVRNVRAVKTLAKGFYPEQFR